MKFRLLCSCVLISGLFSACAFNKLFLQATRLSPSVTKIKFATKDDTCYIAYADSTHQPIFLGAKNDILDLNYTVKCTQFKSSSGNFINVWKMTPKNTPVLATILFFHGNAGFLGEQHFSMVKLLSYGFQCYAIDYSGFGFSSGKISRKNTLMDGNSAVNYVLSKPDAKGKKLILYGQSLGGHLAIVVAKQNEEKIDALVTEGAFSSHKDIAKEVAGGFGKAFVKEMYSAKDSIRLFHKPVLIIHSTEDEVIPFYMGKTLYENANEPKQFYAIDSCHICGSSIYAKEIAEKIKKMILVN